MKTKWAYDDYCIGRLISNSSIIDNKTIIMYRWDGYSLHFWYGLAESIVNGLNEHDPELKSLN